MGVRLYVRASRGEIVHTVVVVTGLRYGEKSLTGCGSASVSNDVGVPFAADIGIRAELWRGGSLLEAMAKSFLTCATVDRVAFYEICSGEGSRGQTRARRK